MSKFPFFSMQQLNLDWLMKQMQKILAFLPIDSGHAGQILQRGSQSARWVNIGAVSMDIHGLETAETVTGSDELPVYNTSVEGNRKMTISALAAMLPSPTAPVTSVNGKTEAVVLDAEDVGALPDSYTAPVTSVNGQTGAVVLDAAAVGALPNTTRYADLYFVGGLQPLTIAVNPSLDASNDCEIIGAGIKYATSADKKTVRVCGTAKIECGSNTGWRTFEITGADIADFPTGVNYLHRDYCCTLYQDIQPARQICLAPTYTYANYRVFSDRTMHFYLSVESWLAGQTVYVVFDDIFQIP